VVGASVVRTGIGERRRTD